MALPPPRRRSDGAERGLVEFRKFVDALPRTHTSSRDCPPRRRANPKCKGADGVAKTPASPWITRVAFGLAISIASQVSERIRTPPAPARVETRQQTPDAAPDYRRPFGPPPYDGGGLIPAYQTRIRQADAQGAQVEIRGTCVSACTMWLGARNVCVHPDAMLWFHAARKSGTRRISRFGNDVMSSYWPPAVRKWADRAGVLDSLDFTQGHVLTGADLIPMGFPACAPRLADKR